MVKMTKAQLLEQVQLLQQQLSHQPPQLQGDNDIAASTTTEAPVVYTHTMVNALLELRFTGFRVSFNADLSSKQLHVLWEKLALRFNILTEQPRKLDSHWQRRAVDPPKPSYYSEMLVAFADLHGLGDIEFGMERTPIASPGAEDDVEVLEDLYAAGSMQQNKRKAEIDLEMQRQRQMRKKQNPDLAAGLSYLGEALVSGLIEAAKVQNSRSSGVDVSEQMTKLLDLMEETKASIDKTNDVNDKMLQFLQGKF
ncbi:hypothetical protein DYB36_014243 [Aphanomyces astaci]|uniref:Uncharacterized protein n=1 Tax=Aphanomyces astaci TaxID=112090 RepID=A0A397BN39_APHAT|nr:hypothetical protein DYB36_014243 [Aphanomyces astaci]